MVLFTSISSNTCKFHVTCMYAVAFVSIAERSVSEINGATSFWLKTFVTIYLDKRKDVLVKPLKLKFKRNEWFYYRVVLEEWLLY